MMLHIYMDIRMAFDGVSHCDFLLKLWKIGIAGKLWNCWFRCYLSNCLHCVSINNLHSDLSPVLSGDPQRNILGPMLFRPRPIMFKTLPIMLLSIAHAHYAQYYAHKY